ncbi:MAG: ATP-binding protein [Ruminococcus sp.]
MRLTVLDVNAAARAAVEQCSEELAARMCRYEAFAQVQADWIATAHTASDNLETLVHRMVRGASLHGLTAIPPRNGRFLRPLLRITREQVETHLAALEQTYVTDSTNLTDDYTRNRIRHHHSGNAGSEPGGRADGFLYPAESASEDNFLTQQASAAYAVVTPQKTPWMGWNSCIRRCGFAVLPCSWRNAVFPAMRLCWNGWNG